MKNVCLKRVNSTFGLLFLLNPEAWPNCTKSIFLVDVNKAHFRFFFFHSWYVVFFSFSELRKTGNLHAEKEKKPAQFTHCM